MASRSGRRKLNAKRAHRPGKDAFERNRRVAKRLRVAEKRDLEHRLETF